MHLSSLVSRGFYRALLGSCSLALLVGVIAPAAHGQRVIRPVRVAGVPAGLPGPYAPGAPCPTPGGATLGVYYQPGARVLYWAAARQDYRFDLPAPIQSWTWSCAGAFIFGANLAWDELVIYDQSGDLIAINPALFGARFRGTRHALGGIGPAQLNGGRCGPGKTAIVPTRGGRRGVSGGRVRAYVGPPGVPFAPPNGPPNLTFNGSGSSAGSATAAAAENVGLRFVESSGLANEFGVSSGHLNATSRSGIAGASHGDILAKFQGDLAGNVGRDFAAIGQGESHAGELNGFRCIIQDQNATTQEQYQFVVVDDDPQSPGQPDASLDGFALRTASLTSPSGSGTAAWRVTVTFSVPQFVLPVTETVYAGLTVAPNPAWQSDGLSVHMGSYNDGCRV